MDGKNGRGDLLMKSLVSVIIPVYNSEEYIERCVLSVLNQNYENIEVILIDNNSDDGAWNICRSMEGVKLIKEPSQGVGMARNRGIESATGEYIAFVDSDDYIEKLISAYDVPDCGLSVCGYFSENEAGKVISKTRGKERVYLRDNAIDCLLRRTCSKVICGTNCFYLKSLKITGSGLRRISSSGRT